METQQPNSPPFLSVKEENNIAICDYDLIALMNALKKLESELEETKLAVKFLKERELETRVALASINAELKKIYKRDNVAAATEELVLARRSSFAGEEDSSGEAIYEEDGTIDSHNVMLVHEYSSPIAHDHHEVQMKKMKPIVPLLGDMFSGKKKDSSPDSIHNLLYTSYNKYFNN